MDVIHTRSSPELASLVASALQTTRFKERRLREAESDVRNEVVYFSPVIQIDNDTQAAILQYRDTETGEIRTQYPSPRQLESYIQAQALEANTEYVFEAVEKEAPARPESQDA